MAVNPILFSGPMVRALLDGRKTQTRRVVKGLPDDITEGPRYWCPPGGHSRDGWANPGINYWTPQGNHLDPCPYGQPGDLLWVRETWGLITLRCLTHPIPDQRQVVYRAGRLALSGKDAPPDYNMDNWPVSWSQDGPPSDGRWRSPIYMPRWASRLTLRLTDVRVERVQEISEDDARAEGVSLSWVTKPRDGTLPPGSFRGGTWRCGLQKTWDSINGKKHPWDSNPWVWVLCFETILRNVDEVLKEAA